MLDLDFTIIGDEQARPGGRLVVDVAGAGVSDEAAVAVELQGARAEGATCGVGILVAGLEDHRVPGMVHGDRVAEDEDLLELPRVDAEPVAVHGRVRQHLGFDIVSKGLIAGYVIVGRVVNVLRGGVVAGDHDRVGAAGHAVGLGRRRAGQRECRAQR